MSSLDPTRNIFRADATPSFKGPADRFTGDVTINRLASATPPGFLAAVRVLFAPNARTVWHSHPKGQILHCIVGVGEFQREGEEIIKLFPGDTVLIEPDVKHWHGAAPDQAFIHIAINADDEAIWMEPVVR